MDVKGNLEMHYWDIWGAILEELVCLKQQKVI